MFSMDPSHHGVKVALRIRAMFRTHVANHTWISRWRQVKPRRGTQVRKPRRCFRSYTGRVRLINYNRPRVETAPSLQDEVRSKDVTPRTTHVPGVIRARCNRRRAGNDSSVRVPHHIRPGKHSVSGTEMMVDS